MLSIILPLLVLVVGLLLWALATNPIVKDFGRMMAGVGLFFVVALASHSTVRLF